MSERPKATNPAPTRVPLEDVTHQDDRERARSLLLRDHDYLFVVLEADRPLAGGARYSLDDIEEIVIGRGRERTASREGGPGAKRLVIELPSRRLSSVHARVKRKGRDWLVSDAGSTNGSYVNGARVETCALAASDVLELGRIFFMLGSAATPADQAAVDLDASELSVKPAFATLRPDISARLAELRRVAPSAMTLILWGETGTGKELLAAAIHEVSARPGPFVAVNCGALPGPLVEAQLFGHVRGAFSGAVADTAGFVRAADRGTLLLDEVQDLSASAQAALLRVLQEREVVPVGSARPLKVDVRFIATAPRPLDLAVQAGKFRADLLGRLHGFSHELVPLRERRQDLGVLTAALLRKAGVRDSDGPTLSLQFAVELVRGDWTLNVRELEQYLVRGWTLAQQGCIDLALSHASAGARAAAESSSARRSELGAEDLELRGQLVDALRQAHGNVAAVARALGKAPMQVRRWLKRFEIDPDSFRG